MRLRSCLVIAVFAAAAASHPACAQVGAGENVPMPLGTHDSADGKSERQLNTLRDLFATLYACITPPALERAHRGMQITMRFAFNREGKIIGPPFVTYSSRDVDQKTRDLYREAIMQSLQDCMPLPFTKGLGNAIAGHPIHFRVIDDRDDAVQ